MLEIWFTNIFLFVSRHKRSILAILCVIIAICAIAVTRIHFDNDISGMFPADPSLRRDFALIQESIFSGKAVLSFELTRSTSSLDDLARYVDKVAARLPGPLVSGIVKGPSFASAIWCSLFSSHLI